ncbi:hypothetical protein WA158_000572 [Blastocystis sp. Blastoise]
MVYDSNRVISLFLKYCNDEQTEIDVFGLEKLGNDLDIDIENDMILLVFAWIMNCERMFVYSKSEFLRLFESQNISSIEELRDQIPKLRLYLHQEKIFKKTKENISKDVWNMTFYFIQKHGFSIDNYDSLSGWPLYLDRFVDSLKNKM